MKPKPHIIKETMTWLNGNESIAKDGKIPSEYKGYVSSFGGAIVQMGIHPACMAYLADTKKKTLVNGFYSVYKKLNIETQADQLSSFLNDWDTMSSSAKKSFRNKMAEIMVAFKISMRTFKFIEEKNDENNH